MQRGSTMQGGEVDRVGAEKRVGTTIDQSWRLDALIGVGGMAAVYSATHASGRRGAFKVMHPHLAHDPQLVTRFVREQSISAKVRHPACIEIHGTGATDDGVPLLVMELLEGETLEQRLKRTGRMSVGEALELGEALLEFLIACHGAGVVHRDLKPANIFLQSGARLKVLDFGVARESTRRQTNRRLAIGTPSYMSPEQARGAMDVDLRTDLFSVGAILYRALVGRELRESSGRSPVPTAPPGGHDDVDAATKPAPSLALAAPGLPMVIARTIDRALSWQRDERWINAEVMLGELRSARASVSPEQLRVPTDLDADRDGDEGSERPTHPGTPSAIRVLQEAELSASVAERAEAESHACPPSTPT